MLNRLAGKNLWLSTFNIAVTELVIALVQNSLFKRLFNSKIVNQFALGVAEENLFELFQRKKFVTKNPTAFSAGTPKILCRVIGCYFNLTKPGPDCL